MIKTDKDLIPEISIIIVNYNSSELLSQCVESILINIQINFEVIVYDNASSDNSVARAKEISDGNHRLKFISSSENIGFAKANNKAAMKAQGKYLHFLNPDTIVDTQLNQEYSRLLTESKNAIFVTGLTESNGQIHKMKHIIPTTGNYLNALFCKREVRYWNIGASIIMDQSTFKQIEGWPEDYFMYAEDLDLFYLAQKKFIPVIYLNGSITHIGKGTTGKVWNNLKRAILIEKSTRLFYKKYRMTSQYFIIRPIQLIFILFKEPDNFILTLKAIILSFIK